MAGTSSGAAAEASQRVLRQIADLYETGLPGLAPPASSSSAHGHAHPGARGAAPSAAAGGLGLAAIARHPLVGLRDVRKPRRKISVMIVGNHSAGKSSFINWYIGERVVKTGVAIETRGFIFCSSGRRRETLGGDATVRYFDHLADMAAFEGILVRHT